MRGRAETPTLLFKSSFASLTSLQHKAKQKRDSLCYACPSISISTCNHGFCNLRFGLQLCWHFGFLNFFSLSSNCYKWNQRINSIWMMGRLNYRGGGAWIECNHRSPICFKMNLSFSSFCLRLKEKKVEWPLFLIAPSWDWGSVNDVFLLVPLFAK